MTPPRPLLLLLDFDGVLADYARARRVSALAALAGVAPPRVQTALFDSGLEEAYDAGRLDTPTYLDRLGQALGTKIDSDAWVAARLAGTRGRPAVADLLGRLPGLPLAVLTNNGPLAEAVVLAAQPALLPRLRGRVLSSGRLGMRKPDPQAYLRALARLDAEPARTLFVDDLFGNVQGARRAGLQAETVRDARSLGRVLKRFGLR
ncbi:MAG: HAD family phosphatase [Pseudoxanthomonas sp.]